VRLLLHAALVAGGSAVGGLARWSLHELSVRLLGKAWPYGTFLINVTGCLLLGWLATVLTQHLKMHYGDAIVDNVRLLVGVGFCGAYTTFSTFGVEADSLFRSGSLTAGFLYVGLSVLGGLMAVRLGVYLGGGV
jgi:fluoride exporter